MNKFISESFINIVLRGATLLSKFIFIFLLGKFAEDEYFLGEYGIITTSISLIIYLVGFDFYVFNTREILKSKESIIKSYLKKNGKTCDRENTFNFFINSLKIMKKLAQENSNKVTVEAYVGKYLEHEIKEITKYVDRLLVHVYVQNPISEFIKK